LTGSTTIPCATAGTKGPENRPDQVYAERALAAARPRPRGWAIHWYDAMCLIQRARHFALRTSMPTSSSGGVHQVALGQGSQTRDGQRRSSRTGMNSIEALTILGINAPPRDTFPHLPGAGLLWFYRTAPKKTGTIELSCTRPSFFSTQYAFALGRELMVLKSRRPTKCRPTPSSAAYPAATFPLPTKR
jgi:hypothetical protein